MEEVEPRLEQRPSLAATAYERDADPDLTQPPPVAAAPPPSPPSAAAPSSPFPAHYLWAMLLARLFESLPLVFPSRGADMRIRAFVTETAPVRRILLALGEPAEPPRIAPARPGATLSCSAWVPAQTVPGLGVRCSTAAHPPTWDDPPVDLGPD